MVNLGDIFYGPIAPRKTYELLRKYEIVPIQGNQDRLIFKASQFEINQNPTPQFVCQELCEKTLYWLEALLSLIN